MTGFRFKTFYAIIVLLISFCFCATSLAEGEFRARDGNGWSLTADGVLTIEDNAGWRDGLKHSVDEKVNKLIIGKNLTKFYLYDEMFEEVEPNFQFPYEAFTDKEGEKYYSDGVYCPWLQPKVIEVQDGNPVFSVEDGLLINNRNHTVVLADSDQRTFVIPEGVTTIGTWAFREREVETVQFPSTLQTIGIASFLGCENLTALKFPSSLKTILAEAFYTCENIQKIDLPESIRSIGVDSFNGCGFRELEIPNGIELMDSGAFSDCRKLERAILPSSLKNLGSSVFTNCTSLTNILLPEGVETIGEEAFLGCENLKKIDLPKTLREISAGAFQDLDFDLVEFPDTLKVGESAFGHIHVAVFSGWKYELSDRSIDQVDIMLFLNNPPQGISKLNANSLFPKVYYTEPFIEAWKAGVANGLNGWPTECISLEEADDLIAQAVATPQPTEKHPATTDVFGFFSNTPEPSIQSDQMDKDAKPDPLVYVLGGLLALVVAGIVVVGVRARKKQHGKPVRKG